MGNSEEGDDLARLRQMIQIGAAELGRGEVIDGPTFFRSWRLKHSRLVAQPEIYSDDRIAEFASSEESVRAFLAKDGGNDSGS